MSPLQFQIAVLEMLFKKYFVKGMDMGGRKTPISSTRLLCIAEASRQPAAMNPDVISGM